MTERGTKTFIGAFVLGALALLVAFYLCVPVTLFALYHLEKLLGNEKYSPFISRCMGQAVATRNLCYDPQSYETEIMEPYRRLQAMELTVEAEERTATAEEMKTATELLLKIFRGKQIPTEEQQARLQTLYLDTGTEGMFSR